MMNRTFPGPNDTNPNLSEPELATATDELAAAPLLGETVLVGPTVILAVVI
jgi:hypothetical protein